MIGSIFWSWWSWLEPRFFFCQAEVENVSHWSVSWWLVREIVNSLKFLDFLANNKNPGPKHVTKIYKNNLFWGNAKPKLANLVQCMKSILGGKKKISSEFLGKTGIPFFTKSFTLKSWAKFWNWSKMVLKVASYFKLTNKFRLENQLILSWFHFAHIL